MEILCDFFVLFLELAVSSPLVHGALRSLSQWQIQLTEQLISREVPINYIPACFPEEQLSGPPINKYRLFYIFYHFFPYFVS